MTETIHSTLGASSAKRWINCPGSVALIAKCPTPTPSKYAVEGTIAHRYAEIAVRQMLDKTYLPALTQEEINAYTDDMTIGAELMRDTIATDMDLVGGQLLIEQKFDLANLHPSLFGTCDYALISDSILIVYDYKFGKGIPVEVDENEQLKYYTLGALKRIASIDSGKSPGTVELVIVQPRAKHKKGPVRRQTIKENKLIDFAKNLRKWAYETENPKAIRQTGDWCQFCAAVAICPEYQATVEQTAMVAFDDDLPTLARPADIDKGRLIKILQNIDMLDDWVAAVKTYALDLAKNGEKFPGFKLVRGRTNRKWSNEDSVIETMGKILGDKIWSAPKLLSPAKMEKLLPKDEKVVVKALIYNPEGAINLVSEDDPRPEITYDPGAEFEDNLSKKG